MLIGSHVPPTDPLGTAAAEDADVIQIFLGDPQDWKKPKPRDDADAAARLVGPDLRARAVHREPGVAQQPHPHPVAQGAAAGLRRRHRHRRPGGHRPRRPRHQGRRPRRRASSAGARASTRSRPRCRSTSRTRPAATTPWPATSTRSAGLWDHIGDTGIGFCLDTCHAWAAGEALVDAVERIKGITGPHRPGPLQRLEGRGRLGPRPPRQPRHRVDRPRPAGGGRVEAAGAPVICETADEGRKDDIAFLKSHVGG